MITFSRYQCSVCQSLFDFYSELEYHLVHECSPGNPCTCWLSFIFPHKRKDCVVHCINTNIFPEASCHKCKRLFSDRRTQNIHKTQFCHSSGGNL